MASLYGYSGQMVVVQEVGFIPGENNVNWSVGIHYINGTLGAAGILKMQWLVPGGDRVSNHHYTTNLDPLFTLYINKRNQYIGLTFYENSWPVPSCYIGTYNCIKWTYLTQPEVWEKIACWVLLYIKPYSVLGPGIACAVWSCDW